MRRRSLVSAFAMAAIMGTLLFGSALSLNWWQGWLYLGLSLAWNVYLIVDLSQRDPELLARRGRAGSRAENRNVQKWIIRLLILVGVALPAVAGWDRRFGWSHMDVWWTLPGLVLFLAGQAGILWVFRANTYARATVEVSDGQTLTDSGPYALVRHPMYSAMLLLSLGVPLLLNSWWALVNAALIALLLAWRLLDEEQMMLKELHGYAEYRARVRSRLVPGIW